MAQEIMKLEIKTDNSKEIIQAMKEQVIATMSSIGQEAEGYAKSNLTAFPRVDSGRLRNSVSFEIDNDELALYVGTNVEYAPYVEFGTGIYADNGEGRQTPWYYYNEKLGKVVMTRGMKPSHFLRDSMSQHSQHYKAILEAALKA